MQKSRLWRIFSSLHSRERRRFSQFIQSVYYNQHPLSIKLQAYLDECISLSLPPTKEAAFRFLYGVEVPFEDVKIRLQMTEVLRLLELFLFTEAQLSDRTTQSLALAGIYRERNLDKDFKRHIQQVERQLEKSDALHADFHRTQYLLQLEEYRFRSQSQRTTDFNLQEISDSLDIYYLALKLRQTCHSLAHQQVFKRKYDDGLMSSFLPQLKEEKYLRIPAISVYYHAYLTLSEPEQPGHFDALLNQIKSFQNHFPLSEQRDLLLIALNYCIRRQNQGQQAYAKPAFDLYRMGLGEGLLIDGGRLSRFTYNNIVAFGLLNEAYDWVESFIHDYRNHLSNEYRLSTFQFNRARVAFERKHFDKALEYIQQTEYRDLLNSLIAKTLQLKIYFSLEEFDLLQSHLDSMEIFLRRKEDMGYHGQNFRNIILFTRRLLRLNPYDATAKEILKRQLDEVEPLTEKAWPRSILDN